MAERKLGRGLDGLLGGNTQAPMPELSPVQGLVPTISITLLDPNPDQPRQGIGRENLEQLKKSIREHGVLQPILVRSRGERYQVIAGERRFRAAQEVGLTEVPAVIREVPDNQMLEIALVENLQREDLDAIEKALSFKAYLAATGRTQEAASARLGLDRSTIANMIRLLELPDEVQTLVRKGLLSMGHARALLSLSDRKRQIAVSERVVREGLSVRQVEHMATAFRPVKSKRRPIAKSAQLRDVESKLREAFGTKVSIEEGPSSGQGRTDY